MRQQRSRPYFSPDICRAATGQRVEVLRSDMAAHKSALGNEVNGRELENIAYADEGLS